MQPAIDHIHITVSDLERTERFYDRFLPLLGFDLEPKETAQVPEHEYRITLVFHQNGGQRQGCGHDAALSVSQGPRCDLARKAGRQDAFLQDRDLRNLSTSGSFLPVLFVTT